MIFWGPTVTVLGREQSVWGKSSWTEINLLPNLLLLRSAAPCWTWDYKWIIRMFSIPQLVICRIFTEMRFINKGSESSWESKNQFSGFHQSINASITAIGNLKQRLTGALTGSNWTVNYTVTLVTSLQVGPPIMHHAWFFTIRLPGYCPFPFFVQINYVRWSRASYIRQDDGIDSLKFSVPHKLRKK